MGHALSNDDLEWAVGAVRDLVARAVEHERHMAALVQKLESDPLHVVGERDRRIVLEAAVETPPSQAGRSTIDVLDALRQQCSTAQNQRLLAESLLTKLRSAKNRGTGSRQTHRVLVVEDTDDIRALAADALERAGFEVGTAANGLEGLIAAHRLQPSVIVTDITMPILDGIETARLLKSSSTTRGMDLIAYTAKPHILEGSVRELFAAIVPKPSSPDRLVSSVMQTIRSKSLDRDS
jgi:two-component system, chemotaxis family, chemotaxis protein CheY